MSYIHNVPSDVLCNISEYLPRQDRYHFLQSSSISQKVYEITQECLKWSERKGDPRAQKLRDRLSLDFSARCMGANICWLQSMLHPVLVSRGAHKLHADRLNCTDRPSNLLVPPRGGCVYWEKRDHYLVVLSLKDRIKTWQWEAWWMHLYLIGSAWTLVFWLPVGSIPTSLDPAFCIIIILITMTFPISLEISHNYRPNRVIQEAINASPRKLFWEGRPVIFDKWYYTQRLKR
jgi:hypothetical protein